MKAQLETWCENLSKEKTELSDTNTCIWLVSYQESSTAFTVHFAFYLIYNQFFFANCKIFQEDSNLTKTRAFEGAGGFSFWSTLTKFNEFW